MNAPEQHLPQPLDPEKAQHDAIMREMQERADKFRTEKSLKAALQDAWRDANVARAERDALRTRERALVELLTEAAEYFRLRNLGGPGNALGRKLAAALSGAPVTMGEEARCEDCAPEFTCWNAGTECRKKLQRIHRTKQAGGQG